MPVVVYSKHELSEGERINIYDDVKIEIDEIVESERLEDGKYKTKATATLVVEDHRR